MAAFNKFNCFVQDVANALHDMKTGTAQVYKVYLTNTAPVATNTVYNMLADLSTVTGIPLGHRHRHRLGRAVVRHLQVRRRHRPGVDRGGRFGRAVSICGALQLYIRDQAADRLVGLRRADHADQRQHVHRRPRPDQRHSDDYVTWRLRLFFLRPARRGLCPTTACSSPPSIASAPVAAVLAASRWRRPVAIPQHRSHARKFDQHRYWRRRAGHRRRWRGGRGTPGSMPPR